MTTFDELRALAVAPLQHLRGKADARPGRAAKRICATKTAYLTVNAARYAATRLARDGGRRQHPYRCPVCHLWHLTKVGRWQ